MRPNRKYKVSSQTEAKTLRQEEEPLFVCTRLDSNRLGSARLHSTRLDSTRLDSTRLDWLLSGCGKGMCWLCLCLRPFNLGLIGRPVGGASRCLRPVRPLEQ